MQATLLQFTIEFSYTLLQYNDFQTDSTCKPPYSYAALICLAMMNTNNKMTLSQIYRSTSHLFMIGSLENFAIVRGLGFTNLECFKYLVVSGNLRGYEIKLSQWKSQKLVVFDNLRWLSHTAFAMAIQGRKYLVKTLFFEDLKRHITIFKWYWTWFP